MKYIKRLLFALIYIPISVLVGAIGIILMVLVTLSLPFWYIISGKFTEPYIVMMAYYFYVEEVIDAVKPNY